MVLEKPKFVGQRLPREDAYEKVTGLAKYAVDITLPWMLHGKVKRSPIAHGRLLSIDIQRALKVPGVRAILTAGDVPDTRRSPIKDSPIFAIGKVHYVGEQVAAVAADTVEAAEEAVELIDVQYEELGGVYDPEESMSRIPPIVIHPDRMRLFKGRYHFEIDPSRPNVTAIFRAIQGDTQENMLKAHLVMENEFRAAPVHHFHTETLSAIVSANPDGNVTIWSAHQSPHQLRLEVAEVLQISPSKVRVIIPFVGGGFGNKEVYGSHLELIGAFLSKKTRRPVKMTLSREEAMIASTVRYPFTIRIKDGVSQEGLLLAREITALANGGAYAGALNVPRNLVFAAVSTYNIPNIRLDSIRVFTNQVPSGAFRGFGSAQVAWAIESQMDMIAEKLGLDAIEFRLRNLLKDGDSNAVGEMMSYKHEAEYLRRAAEHIGWGTKPSDHGSWKRGHGLALTNKISTDPGSTAYVRLRDDGIGEVWSSVVEMGQGTHTGLKQIAAEELGLEPALIRIVRPDTDFTPFDPGTYSSHSLFSVGNALKMACDDLKMKLIRKASMMLDTPEENLAVEAGVVTTKDGSGRRLQFTQLFDRGLTRFGALTETGSDFWGMGTWTMKVGPLDPSNWKVPGGRAGGFYSPAAEAAEVAVNIETGQVKVLDFVVVMNIGRAINPGLVEGQIEGSVAMGLSCALAEELCLEAGRILNADLKDYKVQGSLDAVRITFLPEEHPYEGGPYGAKGVGEAAITGVAPAIGNAIYNAVGVRVKDLPITAEKIRKALGEMNRWETSGRQR